MLKKLKQGLKKILTPQTEPLPGPRSKAAEKPLTKNHLVLQNPYDSAEIDRVIWDAVQENLQDMKTDETLIVIIGEAHSMPSHIMANAGLLTNLARWRDEAPHDPGRGFLFASEQPYDSLTRRSAPAWIKEDLSPRRRHDMHKQDPDHHIAIKNILAHNRYQLAPQSLARVFQTVLRHNISACFNDAAADDESNYLLSHDPVARRIAKKEFNFDLAINHIHAFKAPAGYAIRNATMAARALHKARKKNIRIIVQQSGRDHLYGHLGKKLPYEQSLTARFNRQARCRTLGIYFNIPGDEQTAGKIIDRRAFEDNPHHIIFENAAVNRYSARQPGGEYKFLKRLARSYRPEPCPYAVDDNIPRKNEVQSLMSKLLKR